MCRPTTCKRCGKTTWAGCGRHVDQVMAGVPRTDRCTGHDTAATGASSGPSLLDRLLGRS